RAVVSVLSIPRQVTAADSAAVRTRALALREEILKGAKFEDVAKRESADTISGAQGGSLGRGPKGRFAESFEKAAFAFTPGQAAQETPQGFDSAAKVLKLTPAVGVAMEGEPLTVSGQYVPSVSAWAFSGVKPGATSELFDSDAGYVLARLDSVAAGGLPSVD